MVAYYIFIDFEVFVFIELRINDIWLVINKKNR